MKAKSSRGRIATPEGLDAVYGVHAVQALFERGQPPRELWVQEGRAEARLDGLLESARQADIKCAGVARDTLDGVAKGAVHQGVVAFAPPLQAESEEALWFRLGAWQQPSPPLLLILDGVTDPHNFGACLRSADAAGAHGVIVPKDKAAPLNATVRKVACGAADVMPVYQATNLSRAMARLKTHGVWIVGTAGEAAQSLYRVDLSGPVAIVMGAEGKGMRRLTREGCDLLAKLPMTGSVSSLNVSVATGVCLFEAVRQRHAS